MTTADWLFIVFLAGVFNLTCGFLCGRRLERALLVSDEITYEARKEEFRARLKIKPLWHHLWRDP